MRTQRWMWVVVPGLGLAGIVWLLITGGAIWATLADTERTVVTEALASRLPLLGLAVLAGTGVLGFLLHHYVRPRMTAAARLLEQTRIRLDTDVQHDIGTEGGPTLQGLAAAINQLVKQREALRGDVAAQVRAASHGVELERARLAALMAELTQSVVVCNLDGRVLLYNHRARMQFRALSTSPALAGGSELLGLGRSIYAAFDRKLVAHALETIQTRLQRGAENPSSQFVTITRSGQLLRVQMAPVRDVAPPDTPGAAAPASALAGFVLMLDNVTREFEQDTLRDQLLHSLTEGSRGSLANLRAATEMLEDDDLDAPMRQRFLGVIHDEVHAMTQRIQDLASKSTEGIKTRWPMEDMLGADLVSAAQRRLEDQLPVRASLDTVDAALWLKVDSFSLLLALHYLAGRLVDEFETKVVQLRLQPKDARHAHLDLIWTGQALSTETVMNWELDPMRIGSEASPMSVRDVIDRHGGEFWFERERVRHQAFFRFLLPLAAPQEPLDVARVAPTESRPEFYDFNLFQASEQNHALDDRRLSELAYTIFDTETTGLNPSSGDQIIQIGATRVSGGKLRRAESFEQLINPQCLIPEAGIPIHGITQDMVRGQPTIDEVLPAFHAFVQDTVLVAHNAAFDMRFLQLRQDSTGLVFDQPVLDTLLLSAVVHPNQASHRLEAIAERFDVAVVGRHTALGDAIVTAEVFQKLIPLLQAMGIETLGQARKAAQDTYYARLKY